MKRTLFILSLAFCTYTKAQIISTVAGSGPTGYFGDGGTATAAVINDPIGLAFDAAGNLYIDDTYNDRVRKVNTSGIISTITGTGTSGSSGDGGQATAAQVSNVSGASFDAAGNMYLADQSNNRIRKINTAGVITTVAGIGISGFSGDGGQATSAKLTNPTNVVVDPAGNMYIADYNNQRIRMVNTTGVISTFAGTGTSGFSGDGGQATAAKLFGPQGLCFDAAGNLYISERNNNIIRKVNTSTGIISTVAGNGAQGYSGDGGQATAAALWDPYGICFDAAGNLYIADISNNRIRRVSTSGVMSTAAGSGYGAPSSGGSAGDGGPALAAQLYYPNGIGFDGSGNLYIADSYNNRIRKVTCTPVINMSGPSAVCPGGVTTLTVSGADTYTWSSNAGSLQTNTVVVSPVVTTTYTVTGTSIFGCTATQTISLQVNSLPVVSIAGAGSICTGSHTILTGMGANTYTWSSNAGGSNTNAVNVHPTVNTTYTVTGTDGNGCKNSDTIAVVINPLPVISVSSGTICAGQSFTISANGANTYTYSGGSAVVTPTANATYSVTGTDANGCVNDPAAITNVVVNAAPVVSANTATLCAGNTATLTASGASTYTWSTGTTGASISVSPIVTTNYTVTGTNANNCTNKDTLSVIIENCSMGISQLKTINNILNIYPNPTNGSFIIETNSSVKQTVHIYDVTGKLILVQVINGKSNIDASTLVDGVYNISVISSESILNKKLLIVR